MLLELNMVCKSISLVVKGWERNYLNFPLYAVIKLHFSFLLHAVRLLHSVAVPSEILTVVPRGGGVFTTLHFHAGRGDEKTVGPSVR